MYINSIYITLPEHQTFDSQMCVFRIYEVLDITFELHICRAYPFKVKE